MISIEDAEGDEAWSGAVRFRSLSNLNDIFKLFATARAGLLLDHNSAEQQHELSDTDALVRSTTPMCPL